MRNGRLVNNKLTIPSSLRKYFVKEKNPYGKVSPRVFKNKSQYEMVTGKPMRQKMGFSEKVFGKNGLGENYAVPVEREISQENKRSYYQGRSKSPIEVKNHMFSP